MCLAVPGKVVELFVRGAIKTGLVDFQGSAVEVNLALLPEVGLGDWVLVHAGLAITQLDEREALETWAYLREMGIGEMGIGETGVGEMEPTKQDDSKSQ